MCRYISKHVHSVCIQTNESVCFCFKLGADSGSIAQHGQPSLCCLAAHRILPENSFSSTSSSLKERLFLYQHRKILVHCWEWNSLITATPLWPNFSRCSSERSGTDVQTQQHGRGWRHKLQIQHPTLTNFWNCQIPSEITGRTYR